MTTKELLALVGSFPEANIRNYGDDEVVALNGWGCQMVDAATALCAEVEALRKDAERYRWLLDHWTVRLLTGNVVFRNAFGIEAKDKAGVSAAIDAAKEPTK